jgi:hypothetical protein
MSDSEDRDMELIATVEQADGPRMLVYENEDEGFTEFELDYDDSFESHEWPQYGSSRYELRQHIERNFVDSGFGDLDDASIEWSGRLS